MRPIARQSARLASHSRAKSCSRVRQSSLPRSVVPQQTRAFHYSVKRQSDVRPPNEHNAWLEQQREEQHKVEDGTAAKPEQKHETENVEAKSNGDGRKPGMRGRLRNKRMTDVPKPPPIPDWFLRHNVTLVRDVPPETLLYKEDKEVVRVVDTETGHTLFTVPYYEPPRSAARRTSGERLSIDIEGQKVDISALGIDPAFWKTLPADARKFWITQELVHQRAKSPHEVNLDALGELLVSLPRKEQEEVLKIEAENRRQRNESGDVATESSAGEAKKANGRLSGNFFDQKVYTAPSSTPPPSTDKGWSAFSGPASAANDADRSNPSAYSFLAAEMSARAGLSLAREGQHSSFASNRVDLSLHCPDNDSHDQMDEYVYSLAQAVHADVIRIDANDIEDLTAEYVGQGQDSPGSFSTLGYDVFDGYEATASGRSIKAFDNSAEEDEDLDVDEDEYDEDDGDVDDRPAGGFGSIEDLRKALHEKRHELGKAFQGIGIAGLSIGTPRVLTGAAAQRMMQMNRSSPSSSDVVQWDDARLGALLDGLIDAAKQKRTSLTGPESHKNFRQLPNKSSSAEAYLTQAAQLIVAHLSKSVEGAKAPLRLESQKRTSGANTNNTYSPTGQRTIVHVRDLKDISRSRLGDAVIRKLVRVVQRRRRTGESVLIVGTTAQAQNNIFMSISREAEDSPFRTITVPPLFRPNAAEAKELAAAVEPPAASKTLKQPAYNRILEINLRHVQSMLRRLRPNHETDLLSHEARDQMALSGTHVLTEKVLSLDETQRVVLMAVGLAQSHAQSDIVRPVHIGLATYISMRVDQIVQQWSSNNTMAKISKASKPGGKGTESVDGDAGPSKVEEVRGDCNPHESRLLTGVVDAKNIKTGFGEVHAAPETIEALKTLTTLSLMRPEAFSYGVLAADRLPGLLLYGPPGTGKTLLAKAVAKESKATVLEVSGAQIYEKYVGEGEKMVRAVFSLAKKLSPCVVFIDEADAIFGSRSNAGNRNTHREIINQFLREWDGMDDHSVFMMVATNRPFDLDDAVLRRLPRRLLVDLPVAKDRESILGIHLKNEVVDDSVSLAKLAEQTPLYSGSDLKNLCVAAALACVREENELAVQHKDDKEFKLPEKRTLSERHFEKAIAEISASVSEDMSSLTAIRKFDEQYGDRRGRRKKSGYGFGMGEGVVDESSVRVRSGGPTPP